VDDAFAGGRRAVFEFHLRIGRRDEVTHGVTLVKRDEEATQLRLLPNKGARNLLDGDLTRLHRGEKWPDGMRCEGVALG